METNIPKVTNDLDCLKSLAFLVCAVMGWALTIRYQCRKYYCLVIAF
jgi:hypothetical protein